MMLRLSAPKQSYDKITSVFRGAHVLAEGWSPFSGVVSTATWRMQQDIDLLHVPEYTRKSCVCCILLATHWHPILCQPAALWMRVTAVKAVLPFIVSGVTLRQQHPDWPATNIPFEMQASSCAANPARHIPFLRWLAAMRWAMRRVATIILRAGGGSCGANPPNRRANMPKRLQRIERLSRV